MEEPADIARRLIRDNLYLTVGSADSTGRPWVSPVFYVAQGAERFYWVSSPDALHSRNLVDAAGGEHRDLRFPGGGGGGPGRVHLGPG